MEFLFEYLAFLAQAVSIVVGVLVIISAVASAKTKQPREKGYLSITNLNDRFKSVRYAMENALLEPKELKKARKLESKQEKKDKKATEKNSTQNLDDGSTQKTTDDGKGFSAKLWSIDLTGYNERLVNTPTDASDPSWSSLLSN